MKRNFTLALILIALAVGPAVLSSSKAQTIQSPTILNVCFSQGEKGSNCAKQIVDWIGRANSSIHVLIYGFTLDNIRNALIAAKTRNIQIQIVMDNQQARDPHSEYMNLTAAGLQVRLSKGFNEMHDKVAIIDSHVLITGSFNWSDNSNTHNAENLIIIDSVTLAAQYESHFQVVWTKAGG